MAPPQPWRLPLLLLLPVVISQAATEAHDALSCFYNSRANVSCVWSPAGDLPDTSCRLVAKPKERKWQKTCELLPVAPASWACDLILDQNPDAQKLTAADNVSMRVECQAAAGWKTVTNQSFRPFDRLRLFAPDCLQVALRDTHLCSNITWTVPRTSHYIESRLEFQVQNRTPSQNWGDGPLLFLTQNQQWICLENLAPDTPYEVRVRARARPRLGERPAWSPWSAPLAFRTRAASAQKTQPFAWWYLLVWAVSGTVVFILLTYFLSSSWHVGGWLKKFLKCHIPDPSEFFVQLSSEHGGDFQKWLSSPFPSSAFSPGGPAPEISPLEVLDGEAKAAQWLRLQQGRGPPSPSPSGFTNQGYFFFHLPDALEIEACQVYFTYDPCEEEPEDGVPGAPLLPALPLQPGEDDAYCSFPPGDDLLVFPPGLPGGPAPLSTAPRATGAREDWPGSALQSGAPGGDAPQPRRHPGPGAPNRAQLCPSPDLGEDEEGAPGLPWAGPPGPDPVKAPPACLASNPDAYLSLQELQDQDPAHLV
ncbi:interleukin-2 receptor subunit beta [Sorex fumeus]|uniref:interleukin-2 receptor subunit beta n=1 Tax=Sorex fumeus TaxID=62283 RepID=UPI0024AE7B74|nr:interleukin-2 receptor subunit beta [Sorex fumeus]